MTASTVITSLTEHVAVVTGAGAGIGKALALALAEHGATLALVSRRAGPLGEVAESARARGVQVRTYAADLGREAEVRDFGAAVKRDFGQIDILVHNAAILRMGTVAEGSAEDFNAHYRTNLLSPYLLTQDLLPLLLKRQGQVVFINSTAGLTARANVGQFAASKHALKAIADSLREEVNRHGVRVLTVYPGRTATPNQERLHRLEGRPYRPDRLLQPEDVAAVVLNALCLPRTAEVTEIKIRPMVKWD
jgi:NAD(P)-dependent dehydrogenase (short-subunit alcohol dehydrogenase family)